MIDVDVAELRGAFGARFHRGFGVAQGEDDGVADIPETEVGGDDVLDDTAAAAGALDPDAVVGAVAVAVEEADMADAAGFFAADGADAVAIGDMAAQICDIFGRAIRFPTFFIAAGLDAEGDITHVGETIVHHDVTAGVGVQASVLGDVDGLIILQLPASIFSL